MKLSEYAITKPITAIMTALSVMVLGGIALTRLPLMYAPDLSWPSMYVSASYPSSSPEEVEQKITRPIEEVMGTLNGVKGINARSYSGSSSIRLEFDYGTDMDLAALHVRDRLDQVRDLLPDDLERIEIRRWSTDEWPIMQYSLTWLGSDRTELASVAKNTIVPRLQRLEGVGSVELRGIDEKALLVSADQGLLIAHSLDVRSLSWALRANNQNVSAGYVNVGDKRVAVRSVGEFQTVEQIRHLPIRGDVELKDVADVTYDFPEKKYFERLDGRDAVTMDVRKSSTANMVATARRVKEEMDRIRAEVGPDKLKVDLIRDSSVDVTDGIRNLGISAATGGLLAVLVIFLFLRSFRSTLIIGSAIPISVLSVFVIMYFLRQFFGATITLNLVSMMGLMVAIGMLVDPAVVTLENIYRKRFEDGQDAWHAAMEGSREIGMPVLAAALTTVCVFVPVIFVGGSGGSLWMRDFATTVCISVMASLFVALSLIPLGGSRAFAEGYARADRYIKAALLLLFGGLLAWLIHHVGPGTAAAWAQARSAWLLGGIRDLPLTTWLALLLAAAAVALLYWRCRGGRIKVLYNRFVGTTLTYRWTTVVLASAVLGMGFYLYSKVEKQRFRYQPTRRVYYNLDLPRSYDIKDALALFESIENTLLPLKQTLDIKAISTRFSGRSGSLALYLVPAEKGQLSTDQVKEQVKELLPTDLPGVVYRAGRSSDGVASVGLEIKGRNKDVLAMLAEDIRLRMQDLPKAMEVETSLESGQEEIRVTVNRQRAQRYGLSPMQIASTIATALGSRGNSKFKTDEREIDIQLQLKEEDRATLEQLRNTVFESEAGGLVSFASMAEFDLKRGPQAIERQDRMSTVEVYATTEQRDRYLVGAEMARRVQQIPFPEGYAWQMDRSFRRATEEQGETNFTMIFAGLLIYLIMASLFESYIHPFTIMFSIWFAFTGVAIGLYLLKVPMDRNATYGLLILFGIVVNNGIVLVDHINRYRQQGLCRRDAIIRGGQDRLRPIAMTAITTILGLTPLVIPMLYGTAEGFARTWGPIGLVVICGLTLSTVLTLVLLPTIYSLMDDLAGYARRVVATANRKPA